MGTHPPLLDKNTNTHTQLGKDHRILQYKHPIHYPHFAQEKDRTKTNRITEGSEGRSSDSAPLLSRALQQFNSQEQTATRLRSWRSWSRNILQGGAIDEEARYWLKEPWARSQRTWSLVPVLASTISVMLSKTRRSLWASLPSCERVRSEREEVISKGASHGMNP